MRVCLAWFATLLLAISADAAPVPSPPPTSSLASQAGTPDDTDAFAGNLIAAANWVAQVYVRPVSRADLLQAALAGLYEAARRPVPRNLRRRLDQAEKEAAARSSAEANIDVPAPIVPALAPRRYVAVDDRPLLELLRQIRAELGTSEGLDGENPLRIACRAMLHSLDPYSDLITAAEQHRTIGINSERDGFGLEVPDSAMNRVIIKDVLPGGPAQRAGLRPGDEIIRLRDSDDRERKLTDSLDVLNGRAALVKPSGDSPRIAEPIRVTFRRPGGKEERSVKLSWERFRPESVFGVARRNDNSWNYWLDAERKIAHLRLGNLVEGTPDELSEIVGRLRRNGLRGLILDLRWCPGGALSGSWKTADLFLGEGTIATVRYRNEPETVFRSANEEGKLRDFPMVVLVNGDSIGGAELIASALQDHHRAVVVGQRTRGKGNVQKICGIGSLGLKVTSGTIVRPGGQNLHRFPDSQPADAWGVSPNPGREFRISADLSRALRQWWEQQTLRPGSSAARLPLDDPLMDPQRNAALEALTALMNRKSIAKEARSENRTRRNAD